MLSDPGDEFPCDTSPPSGETTEKESSGVVVALLVKVSSFSTSGDDIFSSERHSGANVDDSKGIEGRKKIEEAEVEQEGGRGKDGEAEDDVARHDGRTASPTAMPLNQSSDDDRSLLVSAIENVLARSRRLYASILERRRHKAGLRSGRHSQNCWLKWAFTWNSRAV